MLTLVILSAFTVAAVAGTVRLLVTDGYSPQPVRVAYDTRQPIN